MEYKNIKKGLEPIISINSKILILGSLPSDKSIIANEYYGNKNNQFWDIISLIFENKKINFNNYNEKIQFLNKYNIALWDVYCLAERKGSLDTDIKNGKFNNIEDLLIKYSNIKTILTNGRTSEKGFKKYVKNNEINCDYKYVPSSSSANTKYSLWEKVECWKKAMFE